MFNSLQAADKAKIESINSAANYKGIESFNFIDDLMKVRKNVAQSLIETPNDTLLNEMFDQYNLQLLRLLNIEYMVLKEV